MIKYTKLYSVRAKVRRHVCLLVVHPNHFKEHVLAPQKAKDTEVPTEQLTFATQMNFKAEKKSMLPKLLQDITSNPGRATKYRKHIHHTLQNKTEKLTPAETLSFFVKADFTKNEMNDDDEKMINTK
ncbi:hypothetical protein AVEN_170920-1 [Araneus ventricosus]|uniref:Uncharacterized protein n=1 Tax=Araneus ventricosus TaxID=182803 RepID=A0A4Y2JDE6_ARAVE|nr:hypothetical protein AVEN_170920-1 [Araneus ventricosus]